MDALNLELVCVLQPLESPKLLEFPKIADGRSCLCFVEARKHVPFDIERVYYINDVPYGESRGSHAHKSLHQVIIILSGSLTVDLDDGESLKSYQLSRADQGLFCPPGYWRNMREFKSGTVCLVLTSAHYDVYDYIRDYDEYLAWRHHPVLR